MAKRLTALRITNSVSGKAWGGIDKSQIWQLLKDAIKDRTEAVADAVREVYAVVKGEVDEKLTDADCWGPHHEVRDDGTVVLSRAGLIAAAAALAGGRSEPNLTDEQKEQARKHLLRHYKELDLDPPESLAGEMVCITARLCGEMSVESIPVSPGVNIDALKAGDDDPLEVVVEIPAGKSKRGWDYLPRSLQDIVDVVNAEGLPGFEGHQAPEKVDYEFRKPVTHWVGALFQDGKAYFRGVIDKAADDLKRWIRGKTIKTVSIWGYPKLAYENGETKVIGYDPLSIDWTPPRRAGMPTRIVAVGEMDSTLDGEMDGSLEGLIEELSRAAAQKVGANGKDRWCYVERTYESYVVVSVSGQGDHKYYKLDYAVDGDKVVLGDPVEVELKRVYEPVESGEMEEAGGGKAMTWKELVAQLKSLMANKEVTLEQIAGEMGLTLEAVALALDAEAYKSLKADSETLAKVRKTLGVTGEMDVVKVAEEATKAVETQRTAEHQTKVNKVLAEKVKGEMAQALVGRMLDVPEGATEEQIAGEIDNLLKDDVVKSILDKAHVDKPAAIGTSGTTEPTRQHTVVKRVSI